jgi:hypothetical protein
MSQNSTAQQHLTATLKAATLDEAITTNAASSRIVPHTQSLPKILTRSYTVGGVVTDITVQLFQERIVVTCSQLQGRIGHWLLCKTTPVDPLNPTKVDWDVSHLLGARGDDPLLTVYAKRITDRILQSNSREATTVPHGHAVLLGIALGVTGKVPAVFHTIVDLILKVYQEATAI